MENTAKFSRRNMLKTGAAALATTAASAGAAFAEWKMPGETRVIYQGGDFYHNPVTQEQMWRRVLSPAGWRLLFAQDINFITPEVLAKTDLFILCRYASDTQSDNLILPWTNERFVEERPKSVDFMSDELEDAIVDNVTNRGMGLLSIHCSVWNGKKKKYMELVGVEKPYMHTKVQPTLLHDLNPTHPITKGIPENMFGDDEIFSADLIPGKSEVLFKLKGEEQPQDKAGGWCHEAGKGRVVTLLPGHTPGPYMSKTFKEIMWRSAFWAIRLDIPPATHIVANGYQPSKPEKSGY